MVPCEVNGSSRDKRHRRVARQTLVFAAPSYLSFSFFSLSIFSASLLSASSHFVLSSAYRERSCEREASFFFITDWLTAFTSVNSLRHDSRSSLVPSSLRVRTDTLDSSPAMYACSCGGVARGSVDFFLRSAAIVVGDDEEGATGGTGAEVGGGGGGALLWTEREDAIDLFGWEG